MNLGGLWGAASNYLGGAINSGVNAVRNFFTPAQKPVLSNTAQSYLGNTPNRPAPMPTPQIHTQSVAPLSSSTTTSYAAPYMPPSAEMQQQNYAPVAQAEGALSSYLAGRDPSAYLTQQYQQLGIPDLQKVLTNQTSDILAQQNNLETLPKEDIARRGDTGMLTAAQRARITASEQAPIREQLLKSQQANAGDTQRLNSLLQLANNYLGAYNQGTQQGATGLQGKIGQAQAGYTAAQNAADRAAQENFMAGQNKQTTTAAEATQNRQVQLAGNLTQEARSGVTLQQLMGKYLAMGLDPDTILSLYNASSRYGMARETAAQLSQRYGVSAGRGA